MINMADGAYIAMRLISLVDLFLGVESVLIVVVGQVPLAYTDIWVLKIRHITDN